MTLGSWHARHRPRRIYLDYASAPPVSGAAEKAMRDAARFIGNPGAIHSEGVAAKKALDDARARIAKLLAVKPREIVFTSGLTEANNLCILGSARAIERTRRTLDGTHWVVSAMEHSSVLDCFAEIERLGGAVSYVEPNHRGIITRDALSAALKKETVFVSVGWANNEIGTIQPLSDMADAIRAHEKQHDSLVLLHSDAGQAPLYLPTTATSLGVDLLALGGNKLYGPHGVGAVCIRSRADIARVLHGGPQERGLRPGTEHVALALGFAAAFEEVAAVRVAESARVLKLRNELASELQKSIPGLIVNGDLAHALPHMLNVSIPGVQSEYLTLQLDRAGIAISTKSACREGEERRSHVVEALMAGQVGDEAWRAENTFRMSLGRDTTARDVRYVAETFKTLVS